MGVAICRRCANYSSSHLGVTETTENSHQLLISCFTCFWCPWHHAMPAILPVTPWSIFQYWPREPHLHTERQGILQSLFIDEETELLICWMTCGPWSSSCCAFCHPGKQGLCFQSPQCHWLVLSSWVLAVFSKAPAAAGPCLHPTSVPPLILSSPVFAFLTHLPSPVPVFFSPSHTSVWELALVGVKMLPESDEPALVGVKMLSESDIFLAAHKVASP